VRKFIVLAVLVGAAVFTAVSLANTGPANVSAKSSQFKLRYLFADVNLTPNETDGQGFRCPKGWHPVSGLFNPDSDDVVTAADAPVSQRKWRVRVRNEGNKKATVTIGAVCEKGLALG
jgi:anaerobic selenocysteine-containing dehydrogenase